jgi:hypothetical protein
MKSGCMKAAQFSPTLALIVDVKTILIFKSARNLKRSKQAYCDTQCTLLCLIIIMFTTNLLF